METVILANARLLAGRFGNKSVEVCHARISAGIISADRRDRAAVLSELPAEADAAVEAGAGPAGYDYQSFECQKCGRVQTVVVEQDPMTSDALGWLAGELRPPS